MRSNGRIIVLLQLFTFCATIFCSSSLLFVVQPIVGRMLLPVLGGTPAIWITCVVFFQGMLLAGYGYTHGLAKLPVRWQVGIHIALLAIAMAWLPIRLADNLDVPASHDPTIWLLGQLLAMLGLPFLVVSSSAPLLQRWYGALPQNESVATSTRQSRDPYFLYAFSNVGSLAALISYPFWFETAFELTTQRQLWFAGYLALTLGFVACGIWLLLTANRKSADSPKLARQGHSIAKDSIEPGALAPHQSVWRQRARWLVLSVVPSSMMLGVTTYLSTDVGSMPLLWVVPLGIYLVTFILAFAKIQLIPQPLLVRALPALLILMGILLLVDLGSSPWLLAGAHLITFFAVAQVCHSELNRTRPSVERLTEFYLLLSIGGFLGGVFNGIVAPALFNQVWEYPLILVAAALIFPRSHAIATTELKAQDKGEDSASAKKRSARHALIVDLAAPFVVLGLAAVISSIESTGLFKAMGMDFKLVAIFVLFILPAIVCYRFVERPLRFSLIYGAIIFVCQAALTDRNVIESERGFFGVNKVAIDHEQGYRTLINGRTMHGLQRLDPERSTDPLSYYHRQGPIGDLFTIVNSSRQLPHVAIVGLGTGSIASYAQAGQRFDFYEIDPVVHRFASDPAYFSFLSQSPGDCQVILGDARIQLEKAERLGRQYDAIVIDAFSSDAIPSHLLTVEAFELYARLLSENTGTGVLAVHITNKHLDLEPLLAAVSQDSGLHARIRRDNLAGDHTDNDGRLSSVWVILASDERALLPFDELPCWQPLSKKRLSRAWTDERNSLLDVISW